MENFIFCAVQRYYCDVFTHKLQSKKRIETKVFLPEKWKKTSKLFFNYHAKLTSVITMGALVYFLAMLIFLYDVIGCDAINVENVHEILGYFF